MVTGDIIEKIMNYKLIVYLAPIGYLRVKQPKRKN